MLSSYLQVSEVRTHVLLVPQLHEKQQQQQGQGQESGGGLLHDPVLGGGTHRS